MYPWYDAALRVGRGSLLLLCPDSCAEKFLADSRALFDLLSAGEPPTQTSKVGGGVRAVLSGVLVRIPDEDKEGQEASGFFFRQHQGDTS